MAWIVLGFGVVISILGAVGVLWPVRLLALVERSWKSPATLALAAVLRVLLGVLLILVAPDSRVPVALLAIGALSILSGLSIPVLGLERIGRLIRAWQAQPPRLVRISASAALAFGAFLVWAIVPALLVSKLP